MSHTSNSHFSSLLSHRGRRASEQPISQLMSAALENPNIISLAAGFVDNDTLPTDHVASSATELLEHPTAGKIALQYGTNEGPAALRSEIAKRNFQHNVDCCAQRMLLTAGSNQLLHLVSECILEQGDIVLCAAPTYFVFLGLLKDMGVRAYGVDSDEHGVSPDSLDECLGQLHSIGQLDRVKALYLIPYFDNPGGTTIPADRRRELIQVFNRWEAVSPMVLLVDNAYRDLRYSGVDFPSFSDLGARSETTIESGTFSKNFSPGVRVGWGVLPEWLRTPIARTKAVIDFGSAHLNQHLMLNLLHSGGFDQQVQRLRDAYSIKLHAMLDACGEHLSPIDGLHFRRPSGGLYVWIQLPPGVDAGPESALWAQSNRHGVLYVPGEFCFPTEGSPVQTNSIRLSFGVQTEAQIRDGIRLLGESISAVHAVVA